MWASLVVSFAAAGLVACGPAHTAPVTLTASDVGVPAEREAPAPAPAQAAAAPRSEAPALPALPGQLACKTKGNSDGTTELALEWNGDSAKGTLRRVAPSGMVYVQHVRAQRADGMIIVDDPNESDLAVHAATLVDRGGKKHLQIGDWKQPWQACQ
jgi:hypothetical protein